MNRSSLPQRLVPYRLAVVVLMLWCSAGVGLSANDKTWSPAWMALRQESIDALSELNRTLVRGSSPDEEVARPSLIVVGFTGGMEGPDSRVSGVVRMRKKIQAYVGDHHSNVTALTFNNREWRPAVRDVLALMGREPGQEPTPDTQAAPLPLIIVYGHSWGAGAITNFARALRDEHVDVALAVYIDAFSLRNPRVPDNVRYAVNIYQRTGIFRGFPLRGKSKLILESPESTVVLANLRIRPDTDRYYGWHWNLVQPFLYRHHHRMSHDVRLQQYLLDLIAAQTAPLEELLSVEHDDEPAGPPQGRAFAGDGFALENTLRLEPIY